MKKDRNLPIVIWVKSDSGSEGPRFKPWKRPKIYQIRNDEIQNIGVAESDKRNKRHQCSIDLWVFSTPVFPAASETGSKTDPLKNCSCNMQEYEPPDATHLKK